MRITQHQLGNKNNVRKLTYVLNWHQVNSHTAEASNASKGLFDLTDRFLLFVDKKLFQDDRSAIHYPVDGLEHVNSTTSITVLTL